ncbi:MAG: glycerol acyltransferase [Marinilabiliales bacterium]|nr:MAG: glycerol acyltransferase [Marinilabiliales bacterium]
MKEDKVNTDIKYINLDEVLKSKSPVLNKAMPWFIKSWLKRVIHQDELNYYIKNHGHLMGIEFIDSVLSEMGVELVTEGMENIPEKGRCIIASNHPLGGLDGIALMLVVGRKRPDLVFPVNDILMNVKNLEPLFIPINKHGSNAENIKIINENFASDKLICYFPFGLVSRKRIGKIEDLEWKTTFITKAKRFKRDVIPANISGRNTNWFYNLSNFRKKLGIKANIEMLYLVDEFAKQKGETLKFYFGKAVSYKTFDKRYKNEQWAEFMRQYSYKLANGYKGDFEEFVSEIK